MNPTQPGVPPVETIARHYDTLDFFYRDLWGEHVHHGLWLTGRESPAEAAEQMSRQVLALVGLCVLAGGFKDKSGFVEYVCISYA